MANLYPKWARKAGVCLIVGVLLAASSQAQKMVTYDTTFGGWNAIVTEDVSLTGTDSAAGIVFFPGIGQETTKLSDLSVNGPHYLINNGLWDGSVPLGNGVHHPFIISLQPPGPGYPAGTVLTKIQAILARYRIKRNSFYMTGLSCGGWQANMFVAYEPTPGDNSAGRMVKAIVNLEGVEPVDSTPIYLSESYPRKMGHWAKQCGGRELWVEGSNDYRDLLDGAQNMMDSVPGSATYFKVTYGGGAHCCWNTEYEPSVTWTTASNSNISQVVGAQVPMNVWQWLLRQGDTSMPKGASGTTPTATPPTVSAGSGQTITLPTSSASLAGKAAANGGATITAVSWKQGSGPATASIGSSNSLNATVSGMTAAGSYVFTLYATDNKGSTSNASVTVTVNAATASAAPTVNAGKGQAITLPATVAYLKGAAVANGGATIVSVYWRQGAGPKTASIGGSTSLNSTISGLTTAGSYVFTLYATDNKGKTSSGSVTVTVNPGVTTAATTPVATTVVTAVAPTVSAGKGQTIALPATVAYLKGTAVANGGATIVSVYWRQGAGPTTASIGGSTSLNSTISGLTVAGSYVFTLYATDNKGNTSNGSMTVTVTPAVATAATQPKAATGEALFVTDSAVKIDSAVTEREAAMEIYPNPVRDLLNLHVNNNATGSVTVAVFDMRGMKVRNVELNKESPDLQTSLDVGRLVPGVYVIEVVTGNRQRVVRKFLKQ